MKDPCKTCPIERTYNDCIETCEDRAEYLEKWKDVEDETEELD